MATIKLARLGTIAGLSLGILSSIAIAAPSAQVSMDVRHDVSAPMRDIIAKFPAPQPQSGAETEIPNIFLKGSAKPITQGLDFSQIGRQTFLINVPAPSTIVAFNGLSRTVGGGGIPPDTNGDVSPTEYIQWVNTSWAIFNKTTQVRTSGPTLGNSFFAGFGGACETTNRGDPIALWDDRAQRWVMSQFTVPATGGSQCFAVSTTADPLGTYNRYEFQFPFFGDYPHIGIWTDESGSQDAYVMVTHEFVLTPQAFQGAAFIAVERDKMLAGLPAAMVRFPGLSTAYGAEPAHLEGTLHAPANSCPPFVHFDADTSQYLFWDLCLNWASPTASTLSATPQRISARAPFVPNYTQTAQTGTASVLDSFGTHIMYRASTRAFPAGAPSPVSMVVTHSVVGAADQGGVKWVQFGLNKPVSQAVGTIFASGFENPPAVALAKTLIDEGTYEPDTKTRWMGAIGIDKSANIGLGYSVSSATTSPELKINGRTLDDPAGLLRDEQSCTPAGTGSQTSTSARWGDYASMSVDPADDCTFWFTSEYYPVTATTTWNTRICSFKFPSCGQPNFSVVADSPSRLQICLATASAVPTYDFRAGVLDGLNAAVSFSVTGLPGSVTPSFNPATISPTPGTTRLTLNGALALASGEYTGTVTGTSGAQTRMVPISLGVSAALPAAPTLSAPANGATGVKVRPTLSWAAVPGALSYLVQVSTDAGFSAITASASVTTTSWAVSVSLTPGTAYFWRVTPNNYCGVGTTSAVRSFTPGVPGSCPSGTSLSTVFTDDFQSGANGWVIGGTGASNWTQGPATAGTGLTGTVWSMINNPTTSDKTLTSPNIVIPAGAAAVYLSYDAYHSFETDGAGCFDGTGLEAKLAADANFSFLAANRMFTDPYTGPISAGAPLAGRAAWCAQTIAPPVRSIVDLDDFAGQTMQIRFRTTADGGAVGVSPNGMHIDNLKVEVCQ